MKTLLKIVGVLVVIAAVAIWYLASNLDGLAKQVIENVGTETLATDVSLDGVKIQLGSESGAALTGLTIANPSGWSAPYAFELGTIGASIAPASLSKEVIEIPRIVIEDARMTFEQKGTKTNLQALLDNIDTGDQDTTEEEPAAEGEDILIAIGELSLKGIGVTAISDQLEEPLEFVLDELVVRDIGTPAAGATPAEAAKEIVGPITNAVLDEAKGQVAAIVEQRVRAEIDKKKGEVTEGLKNSLLDKLGR